ncbi:MAG: MEKHLA domain-containing protein [Planctomycetia bacterium]
MPPPTAAPGDPGHVRLLLDSFARLLGRELVDRSGGPAEQAERLFHAPFVVVAHGTEADPILAYGNAAALALWEMDWATLTRTPSRLTAEPVHRDERARLLARTLRDGFVDDYAGIRISSTGKRFRIEQAIVWNLVDAGGVVHGQAATFDRWTSLPVAGTGQASIMPTTPED